MKDGPAFQCYARDLLVSTAHMTPTAFGGFWRLICHQWDRGGIPDNTEILIALSGCDPDTIAEFRDKFDKSKKDGLLRNKKLEKVRAEQRKYRASRSRNAANRWKKASKIDAHAQHMESISPCIDHALLPASASAKVLSTHRGSGIPKDEAQAVEWASMEMVPPEFAKEVFHQLSGRNWVDGAGQSVDGWRSHIKYRWIKRKGEDEERKRGAPAAGKRTLTPLDLKTIREAKCALADQIKDKHAAEGAMGMTWDNESKRQDWIKLRQEIKQLNQQLSNLG